MPEKIEYKSEIKTAEKPEFKELIRQQALYQIEESIKTPEDLASFQDWRGLDQEGREARQIRKIVELTTAAKSISEKNPQEKEKIGQDLLEVLNLKENIASRSRVEQFQALLATRALGLQEPAGVRKEVKNIFKGLEKSKSTEGELDALDLLSSSKIDFGLKREWVRAYFLPRMNFLARRDLKEAEEVPLLPGKAPDEKILEMPEFPPQDQDFLRPSIDETEKKEGEAAGYFSVSPFYGGYWKEKAFEEWDNKTLCFRAGLRRLKEPPEIKIDEKTERKMQGFVSAKTKTPLPCAYNFSFSPKSLKFPKETGLKILQDEQDNYVLETAAETPVPFSISLSRKKEARKKEETPQTIEIETGKLSKETEGFLAELKKKQVSPIEKARELKQYVRHLLEYPGRGDSSYNNIYYQEPGKFFQQIEQFKKADCDVANAFFIAFLSRLGIPARLAVGHYIKIKDHQGRAVFSSGSRHAWTEVWDDGWHRLDATPKGAPELDEEEMDEKEKDENFEGDFGEIEAEILSDDELREMIEEAKKMWKEEDERKKPPEEIRASVFAKEAECDLEEAKEVISQIEKARQLKDSKGRNILGLLSKEFFKIIKDNLREVLSYRAPVRLPEADELDEPVEAHLDIRAGEAEPGGFKKYEIKLEKVQEYGGFDVILVCDKSGSMVEIDPSSGQEKWREQQKFVYLTLEALHKFSHYCRVHRIKLISPIDVRTGLITFQAGAADLVFPLSDKWGPKEQYQVWKSLQENIGGGTPDHLGLEVAQKMILDDVEKQKGAKKRELKKRLRLVIVTADGGSDDKRAVQSALKKLKEENVIIEGAGLTQAAREIEATYYPNGQCLSSVREAPEWVAQRLISKIEKLHPRKIKK